MEKQSYVMGDLGPARLINDNLEQFLNTWNMVLDSLTFDPDENTKCHYFVLAIVHTSRQISTCTTGARMRKTPNTFAMHFVASS